jgi:hypothetical protein
MVLLIDYVVFVIFFVFLVSLKTDDKDKYKVYSENFERAYLNETTRFYKQKTGQYLTEHGILSYLHYADQKLKVIFIIFFIEK